TSTGCVPRRLGTGASRSSVHLHSPSGRDLRSLDTLSTSFASNSRPALRRGTTTQSAYHTRWPNSEGTSPILRIALDQKVEGSNPPSPAKCFFGQSVKPLNPPALVQRR